jgi:hypothetical protein
MAKPRWPSPIAYEFLKKGGLTMDDMLRKALREFIGPHHQFFEALVGEDSDVWLTSFKRYMRKEVAWNLSAGDRIPIPAREKLVAKRDFAENAIFFLDVLISRVGKDFRSWFYGKIEDPTAETVLRRQTVRAESNMKVILTELRREATKTRLSHVRYLLERQASGGMGVLNSDGHRNFFFIPDKDNIRRIVGVCRNVGGWNIYGDTEKTFAYPGDRIFSLDHD